MARIKFGSIVTDGRGSLGGHTFQNSRGGMQLRTKPVNKKRPSAAQELIRSYNPKLQAGWRSLTDEQRKIWDEYAVSHHVTNKSGDKHPLSGHSLWMKYQFQYINNGLSLQSNVFKASAGPFGPELIQNGNFQSSDFWLPVTNWSISGGAAHYDALARDYLNQFLSVETGKSYRCVMVSSAVSGTIVTGLLGSPTAWCWAAPYSSIFDLSIGVNILDLTCVGPSTIFRIRGQETSTPWSLESISLKVFL